jgi:hypothetical protein
MTSPKNPSSRKPPVAAYAALFDGDGHLDHVDLFEDRLTPRRKRRRASVKRLIAQARRLGADATVDTGNGSVTLHFGEREPASSEWN